MRQAVLSGYTGRKGYNMIINSLDPKMYSYSLKTVGNWKSLHCTEKGFYFLFCGRRMYLDNVLRLSYPYFYRGKDGKDGVISGCFGITNNYGLYVEIHPDCESIRLWEIAGE